MWQTKNSDYEEKCSEVFVYYKVHLGQFVLCNALSVYRAFLLFLKLLSVKNSVRSQKRGQMSESTVKNLVYCRLDPEASFAEFYGKKECQTIRAKGSQCREIRTDET